MRRSRELTLVVALTAAAGGCSSVTPPPPHPGDEAFAAGAHADAVAAYRAGLRAGRPLDAAQRARLTVATAAVGGCRGDCDEISDVAHELEAVYGASPEVTVLWELHRSCRDAAASRRATAATISDLESRLARARSDAAALATRSRELEERLGQMEDDRDELRARLEKLRDRLREATDDAARLERQIEELKRIDLDDGG